MFWHSMGLCHKLPDVFAPVIGKYSMPAPQSLHETCLHPTLPNAHHENERRTWRAMALTLAVMAFEIGGGYAFGSMALLADGWHMATDAAALGIAVFGYRFARSHASNPAFAFGTGKVGALGGFASALVLGIVGLAVLFESGMRLIHPVAVEFGPAILIAVLGLGVNLLSAWLLGGHHHDHDDHDHAGHHHDLNLAAAYAHVLADAVTSVTAIVALVCGRYFGWVWADAISGLLGGALILRWSWRLVHQSGSTLLDHSPDEALRHGIRQTLESDGAHVVDLHVWPLAPGRLAVMASLSGATRPLAEYQARLAAFGLAHVTVELRPQP